MNIRFRYITLYYSSINISASFTVFDVYDVTGTYLGLNLEMPNTTCDKQTEIHTNEGKWLHINYPVETGVQGVSSDVKLKIYIIMSH